MIAWGSPSEAEAQAMIRAFEVTLHPPVGRHVSLVDVRELASVDAAGFEVIHDYMTSRRDAFVPVVERQALLCRPGAFGAAIIGMYHLMAPLYPFSVFPDLDQALAFLSSERHTERRADLDALHEQIFSTPTFLLRLRAALEASKTVPSVAALARGFGMSARIFQRRLADHQTGYHSELQRWRINRAEHLLATSVLSMSEIAKRLGFAAASSFVAAFRAARGVTPEAWRQQRRATPT